VEIWQSSNKNKNVPFSELIGHCGCLKNCIINLFSPVTCHDMIASMTISYIMVVNCTRLYIGAICVKI